MSARRYASGKPAFSRCGRRRHSHRRGILVVGGAGYVGSVLCRRLLDSGYRVKTLDALVYGDEGIRELYAHPRFEVVEGDLRNIASICRAVRFVDDIVHLGGIVGDPACALDERMTLEINLEATATLADIALGLGVDRFVFASSCSVYGASTEFLYEDSQLNPVSLYARTKIESEQLLFERASPEFAPIILRFGTFYGLSSRARFDIVVNLLTAKAVTEGVITVFGGEQWRPFIHVKDGADLIMRCLEAPREAVAGEVFNAGCDDQNYSITQIADLIARVIPGTRVDYQIAPGAEADYRVSFEKVRRQLHFMPTHTVVEGILEMKEAIERETIADYRHNRYSNHKALIAGIPALLFPPRQDLTVPSGEAG
jgi:nucleoside-diphosphate-sugar epimerase